jgi:hypothetical protein
MFCLSAPDFLQILFFVCTSVVNLFLGGCFLFAVVVCEVEEKTYVHFY